MQPAETPKCPNGEDIAVGGVTDGTRLVEYPSNVLLRDRQTARWCGWQETTGCPGHCWAHHVPEFPTKSHTWLPFQVRESTDAVAAWCPGHVQHWGSPWREKRESTYLRPVAVGQLLIDQQLDAPFQHVNVRVPAEYKGDTVSHLSIIRTVCIPLPKWELNHLRSAPDLTKSCNSRVPGNTNTARFSRPLLYPGSPSSGINSLTGWTTALVSPPLQRCVTKKCGWVHGPH